MIVLDTNVVSELMRTSPNPDGREVDCQPPCRGPVHSRQLVNPNCRYGAAIMPAGRRGETLVSDIETMLHAAFENRILPFDSGAARAYAVIAAKRRFKGCSVAPSGLPDRGDCSGARHDGGDAQRSGIRGYAESIYSTPWDGA